ncbi:DUF3085 domain-containing protein [Brucella anthropi]|uniref:DUF3085 domain-containing protein n=1 Tax=Brucella anthropi TaxID=529 RepID=UPI00056B6219|nr:DUF3085 domain-containing protein [Brucella anthropi]
MLRFQGADLRPVIAEAVANNCGISLAKDQGVYFLADEGERTPEGRRKHIAYAVDCNPDTDPFDTWWETARAELGGDDFVERFDVQDSVFQRILNSNDDLQLSATETHLSIEAAPPA